MKKLTKDDYLFDGFAHRQFKEDIDGWINTQPRKEDYPSLKIANDMFAMFEELKAARRKIWELERELKIWQK